MKTHAYLIALDSELPLSIIFRFQQFIVIKHFSGEFICSCLLIDFYLQHANMFSMERSFSLYFLSPPYWSCCFFSRIRSKRFQLQFKHEQNRKKITIQIHNVKSHRTWGNPFSKYLEITSIHSTHHFSVVFAEIIADFGFSDIKMLDHFNDSSKSNNLTTSLSAWCFICMAN